MILFCVRLTINWALEKGHPVYSRQESRVIRNRNTIGSDSSLSCISGQVKENIKFSELRYQLPDDAVQKIKVTMFGIQVNCCRTGNTVKQFCCKQLQWKI